jgi:hypothetical protein
LDASLSNGFLIFLLVELYVISTMALALLISTFFTQAKLAAAVSGILYFCL